MRGTVAPRFFAAAASRWRTREPGNDSRTDYIALFSGRRHTAYCKGSATGFGVRTSATQKTVKQNRTCPGTSWSRHRAASEHRKAVLDRQSAKARQLRDAVSRPFAGTRNAEGA